MSNIWSEIHNNYCESGDWKDIGIDRYITIDAWKTDDDCEEGKVIAKVILTSGEERCVVYFDEAAKFDSLAQEKINEALEMIKPLYSIRIVEEPDDDVDTFSYDVDVYDDEYDRNNFGVGHLKTLAEAVTAMDEIIKLHPQYKFEILECIDRNGNDIDYKKGGQ